MATSSILTRDDYEAYLVHLYFGGPGEYLDRCVNRAYLDFSRTLHGLSAVETKGVLYTQARQTLIDHLALLCDPRTRPETTEAFDEWHRAVCTHLMTLYHTHAYDMYIGQAQKWVNMTLKYIFTMGEERVPGFQAVYPFCHVPIDSIVLERFRPYHPPPLPIRWSRIDDYDQYLAYQHWLRQRFTRLPLDNEFLLWMRGTPPE